MRLSGGKEGGLVEKGGGRRTQIESRLIQGRGEEEKRGKFFAVKRWKSV